MKKIFYLINCFFFLFFISGMPAQAHWSDMAVMELKIANNRAEANLVFPTSFLYVFDKNKNGDISNQEVIEAKDFLQLILEQQISLKGDGKFGQLTILPAERKITSIESAKYQSTLHLQWKWEKSVKNISMHFGLLPKGATNAKCLVSADINNHTVSIVFDQNNKDRDLYSISKFENFKEFLLLGIGHIGTGYDHILFLIALILAGGNFKYLTKIVTAFTLAHSITLCLAVLNIVSVPSRLVESCIAASIIYVAVENLWRKKDEAHWILVFLFGLIHGLGFANILREMAIPRDQLIISLASFNIGIETGQIIIVTLAWVLLRMFINSKEHWQKNIKTGGSLAIAAMASIWFVERVFL